MKKNYETNEIVILLKEIKKENPDYLYLFDLGMDYFKKAEKGSLHEEKVRNYFFLLSEDPRLFKLDRKIYSFAMDVFVYTGGAYEYCSDYMKMKPAKIYAEKIRDLLVDLNQQGGR